MIHKFPAFGARSGHGRLPRSGPAADVRRLRTAAYPRPTMSRVSMDRRISAPCALVAVILGSVGCATPAAADPVPPGWEARNFAPVGYSTVGDRKGAFKMALKKVNGRWYMYMGHLWHFGWSIVDVTHPRDPKFVKFIPGADNTWNIQVTLHDNLMLTALQKSTPIWGGDPTKPQDEGVLIWDLSDPINPTQLAHWKTGAS